MKILMGSQISVLRMVPRTKLLRCLKSPAIIATFICCLIYVILIPHRKFHYVSMYRETRRNRTVYISSALERELESMCPLLEPSNNDLLILKGKGHEKLASQTTQDNKLICDVIRMCDRFSYLVQCRTSECSLFRVDFNLNKSSKSNVTMDLLEKIIFDQIFNDRDHRDLQSKLVVFCVSKYISKIRKPLKLSLEILYSEDKFCYETDLYSRDLFKSQVRFPFDIRFFHFTQITRFEFSNKFHNFASVHLSLLNDKVEVIDFKRVQAEKFDETDMLKNILPQQLYNSRFNSICFNVVDLMCNISNVRKIFMTKFMDNIQVPCRKLISLLSIEDHDIVQRYCKRISRSKLTEGSARVSYYYDFYSLLTMAHITNTFENPLISTSIVNISEVRTQQIEHLDKALTNIVSEQLAKQNSIVILTSDTGHSSSMSLKSKEFFHVQASNPMLYILLPKRLRLSLGEDFMSILKYNSLRLVAFKDIQQTIIDLMEESLGPPEGEATQGSHFGYSLIKQERGTRSCSDFNIVPPQLCVCEGSFTSYPNDTIQIAFAEYIIGTLNKELSESGTTCNYISGESFTNVRVAHIKGSRHILLDVDINLDRYGTIYQINDIEIIFSNFKLRRKFDIKMKELDFKDKKILTEFTQFGCAAYTEPPNSTVMNINYANLKGFGIEPEIIPLHQQCLILILRNFGDSVTYVIGNYCQSRRYRVVFNVEMVNMISTTSLPLFVTLESGDIQYLTSAFKQAYGTQDFSQRYQYDVHYEIFA